MNGMQRRQDDARSAGAEEVDPTTTEVEPMFSPRENNSTKSDGECRTPESQSADVDKVPEDEEDGKWTTIRDVLERFAGDTSLLGVPRAILATTRLNRLFWVVVCVTCMIMFIQGTAEQMDRYFQYPKQVRSSEHFAYRLHGQWRIHIHFSLSTHLPRVPKWWQWLRGSTPDRLTDHF